MLLWSRRTLNQRVEGSSPSAPTNFSRCRESASRYRKPRLLRAPGASSCRRLCSRARLVFSLRGVRTTRRCRGCRAVKRVKSSGLGNAVAMTHDRRIVNSGGRQKWHGHDHYDGPHSTLPRLEWQRLSHNTTRIRPCSMFPVKNASRVARCAQGRALHVWLPGRLWFADDGHVDRIDRSGDVHPFAIPDRRLVVVRRYVHDPALIARPAIVIAFGGEGRAREAEHQNPNEKISSHSRSPSLLGLLSRQLPRRQAKGYADSAELRTGLGVFGFRLCRKYHHRAS